MFEYMACRKPVIVGIDGEAKKIVKDSKSGICRTPENPEMLSKAILTYFNDKEKEESTVKNGFSYVTKNLQKEVLISSLMKKLIKVLTKNIYNRIIFFIIYYLIFFQILLLML